MIKVHISDSLAKSERGLLEKIRFVVTDEEISLLNCEILIVIHGYRDLTLNLNSFSVKRAA